MLPDIFHTIGALDHHLALSLPRPLPTWPATVIGEDKTTEVLLRPLALLPLLLRLMTLGQPQGTVGQLHLAMEGHLTGMRLLMQPLHLINPKHGGKTIIILGQDRQIGMRQLHMTENAGMSLIDLLREGDGPMTMMGDTEVYRRRHLDPKTTSTPLHATSTADAHHLLSRRTDQHPFMAHPPVSGHAAGVPVRSAATTHAHR